jgi:hypothetical protein
MNMDSIKKLAQNAWDHAPQIAIGALVTTGVAAIALIAHNSGEEPKPNYLLEIDEDCFEALKEPGSCHFWETSNANIFLQRKLPIE